MSQPQIMASKTTSFGWSWLWLCIHTTYSGLDWMVSGQARACIRGCHSRIWIRGFIFYTSYELIDAKGIINNNLNSIIIHSNFRYEISASLNVTISLYNIVKFAVMPQYLGNSIQTVTEGGKLFTQIGDKLTEVVYATNAELAKLPYDLAEGNYIWNNLFSSKTFVLYG